MKRLAILMVFLLLLTTYYLSSIPGLQIVPVLAQINEFLLSLDAIFSLLAEEISASVPVDAPDELGPFMVVGEDALVYARENPILIEYVLRKIAHIVLFFIIAMAFFMMLRYFFKNPRWAIWCTFLCATVVAVLDEYHQSMVPDRVGDPFDVLINLVGIILAIILIRLSYFLTSFHREEIQHATIEDAVTEKHEETVKQKSKNFKEIGKTTDNTEAEINHSSVNKEDSIVDGTE